MGEAIASALGLAFCLFGAAWLALAMRVHWAQAFSGVVLDYRTVLILRVMGGAALLVGLLMFLQASHVTMAVLVWIMALAGSVFIVAMALAWRPRVLALAAPWLLGAPSIKS